MLKNLALYAGLCFTLSSTLVGSSQARASLSSPKRYSEQSAPVQKALKPEIQIHSDELKWSLNQDKVQGQLLVDVVLSTLNKFHLYEARTSFTMAPEVAEGWTLAVIQKPSPTRFFDPISKSLVPGYQGQAQFRLSLKPKNATAAKIAQSGGLAVIASFQACSDTVCLFPAQLILDIPSATGHSAGDKSTLATSSQSPSFFSQTHLEELLSQKLGHSAWAFLILFLAGVLTAFTPCVYPMYPITIGIFSGWSAQNKTNSMGLSVLYCLGMTLAYAVLGLITAATGAVFGSLTQSPWFLIGIGSLLFVSSILFSGLIPFSLPAKLIHKFTAHNPHSKIGPHLQSFMFGATLGIVASPCVGPVLIAVLTWTSALLASQDLNAYLLGFAYLAAFGLGMSAPFLVMAQMILKLKVSPSLGRWTPWIKRLGTVLLMASSLFFLVPGFEYLRLQQGASVSPHQTLYPEYTVYDAPQGIAQVIDFRADWCASCLEIESKTLMHPEVAAFFKSRKVSLVKVDLTTLTPELEDIAKRYGVLSLPSLIFLSSEGEICPALNIYEFVNAPEMLKRLRDPCLKIPATNSTTSSNSITN